ncbi:MAG: 16S rRNA (uracil(1498)-N(3))-methyltransferase [Leucobacter sp.]
MANLYYREDIESTAFQPGALIEVTGEEARHAVKVSRLRTGERILVGNGRGAVGEGLVEETARDRFTVRIERIERAIAVRHRLVLVQALAKGDRDERAVEQATEFGADAIVPWQAERSVSRWRGAGGSDKALRGDRAERGDKAEKGSAKWRRIAREASKQSLRLRVPEVRELVTLEELCELASDESVEVVALDPRSGRRLSEWAATEPAQVAKEILVVVGPEGGFSREELDALESAGAHALKLGSSVLRTSSAGPAALAVLNSAWGRW